MKAKLIKIYNYLKWLEKERINAMVHTGRGFN
jgi:hypothetical protein